VAIGRWPVLESECEPVVLNYGEIQRKLDEEVERGLDDSSYHEAGHAVFALHLRRRFRKVTLRAVACSLGGRFDPHHDSLARVVFVPRRKRVRLYDGRYRAHAEQEVLIAMAGPLAEARSRGEDVDWGEVVGADAEIISSYTRSHSLGDREVTARYTDWLRARASLLLGSYWSEIEAVAGVLQERRELCEEEVKQLCRATRSERLETA
jgi:hypothetical protein